MENKEKKNLINRPPVVVVLGHVDHGKSSLLCAIKDFKICEKESGGITQHIGAYEIEHNDKKITFIDTPGHEAFSAMRSRGAKVADIAILVVAAEEGVKDQTKEVIKHVKECNIPLIVAINKMDKPQADPFRVRRELSQNDIQVEAEGGKIPCVEVSATTGQNISELLDIILLIAEMEDLKADPSVSPEGVIIESYLDSKRGPTTTLLVKQGTLKKGDIVGTNSVCGKLKILEDFQGKQINEAYPSTPVIALGFEKAPMVGERFKSFKELNVCYDSTKEEQKDFSSDSSSDKKTVKLILKADVIGSLEALNKVLSALPQENAEIQVLKAEVGEISEGDLKLALSSGAKIVGFRVKTNPQAQQIARNQNVTIMNFDVIYKLVEAIQILLEKASKPKQELKEIGRAKILEVFRTEKNRQILGGKIIEGEMRKGTKIEILRGEETEGRGRIVTLQKNKKDTDLVKKREEFGILFESDTKVKENDILVIKAYE